MTAAPSGWADMLHGVTREGAFPTRMDEPFVLLDDARADVRGVLFRDPIEIIEARALNEVVPALECIRDAVRNGRYAAGYLGYEAGFALESRVAGLHRPGTDNPLLWFGLFDAPLALRIPPPDPGPSGGADKPCLAIAASRYRDTVEDILALIEAGDCYQVNFTIQTAMEGRINPLSEFRRLRSTQKAGWGGLLSTGKGGLVSCSPELFFALGGERIWTKPMKGTAPRGANPTEDAANIDRLRQDTKERAENLMIVDLLRNDLSRVSHPGSVITETLFAVETYPTVHQMTSTITARPVGGIGAIDVLRHLFPCGSITGAPKIRAMEIIAEKESRNRGAYTGSMGYIAPDGQSAFNVLIRTQEFDGSGSCEIGVGSGIVSDSIPENEWKECLTKIRFLGGVDERQCGGRAPG